MKANYFYFMSKQYQEIQENILNKYFRIWRTFILLIQKISNPKI